MPSDDPNLSPNILDKAGRPPVSTDLLTLQKPAPAARRRVNRAIDDLISS